MLPRLSLLTVLCVLAACGQSGDLYLPEPKAQSAPAPAATPPAAAPTTADDEEDASPAPTAPAAP